ncbi:MAG TPA: hypothetical protein VM888_10565, partial [Chitinophagaceae bacterium]|nr:hypothetical protein [Chitinophagaceae bacterium]
MIQLKLYQKLAVYLTGMHILSVAAAFGQSDFSYVAGKPSDAKHGTYITRAEEGTEKKLLFSVLKELNKAKGIYFLFSEKNVGAKMVNDVKNIQGETEKILTDILRNTGLKFK